MTVSPAWPGDPGALGLRAGPTARAQVADRESAPVLGATVAAAAAPLPEEETPGRRGRRLIAGLDGSAVAPARSIDAGAGTATVADDGPVDDSPVDDGPVLVYGVGVHDRWAPLTVVNGRHNALMIG